MPRLTFSSRLFAFRSRRSLARPALLTISLAAATFACAPSEPPAAPATAPPEAQAPAPPSPPRPARARTSVTILHTNDLHSRLDAVPSKTGAEPELGGLARRKSVVDRIRKEQGDNVLLFDAGDFSHGTALYVVWRGSSDIMGMNALGYDAITLGNHELDSGPASLGRVLRGEPVSVAGRSHETEKARMPVVVSNLDVTGEPSLAGLIVPRAIVTRGAERFGVVGAVTESLALFSNGGPNVRTLPYVASVQAQVDALTAEGIDKIVLVSHCGSGVDLEHAPKLAGVDVVVAGHDHVLFGDADAIRKAGLPDQAARVKHPYPVAVKAKDGRTTLVVSALEWGRWLGRLDVTFDEAGAIVDGGWKGEPIPLRGGAEDAAVLAKVETYRAPVRELASRGVGTAAGDLPGAARGESALGDVTADAMLAQAARHGATIALADGDLRADIPRGPVTFQHVLDAWLYETGIFVVELTGRELEEAILRGLALEQAGESAQFQVAGLTIEVARAKGSSGPPKLRLVAGGRPVAPDVRYRVAVNDYMAKGPDGLTMFPAACARSKEACVKTDIGVREALVRAFEKGKPIAPPARKRVVEVTKP